MRILRLSFVMALLTAASACSSQQDADLPAAIPLQTPQFNLDLISTANCQLLLGRLRKCEIAPRTLFPPSVEHAVPKRTVLRRVATGNCSTPYSLEVTVSAPELQEERRFQFLQEQRLILRAPGGAPLSELAVRDTSAWTSTAAFDQSCLIRAQISMNEPDVETAEQAQAILDSIELARQNAVRERDSYQQLVLFHASYAFLQAVAANLHQEITNDMMQQLRAAHIAALGAFDDLAASPSCASALGSGVDKILDLADAMFILGDPSDWQNTDGTTKTLADVYSELGGAGVVAQIETLAAQANPSLKGQYEAAYEEAALAVAELEAKKALAAEELAPWLGL